MLETLLAKLGADPKTTVTAIVGAVVSLTAIFGFEVSTEIQGAIITVVVLVLGMVARDTKQIPPAPAP